MFIQDFIVVGGGTFPLDMLRYDSCFPAYQADVEKIDTRLMQGTREVCLRRYTRTKNDRVTVGRWLSFGWQVKKHTSRKV